MTLDTLKNLGDYVTNNMDLHRVFFFDEFADSHVPDRLQIVFCTHSVVFPIPIVHAIDEFAGILGALKTELGIPSSSMIYSRTFFEQIGALLISWSTADAVAPLQVVDIRKISTANGTIHSTRCDQIF
jgi:hypothetical protein